MEQFSYDFQERYVEDITKDVPMQNVSPDSLMRHFVAVSVPNISISAYMRHFCRVGYLKTKSRFNRSSYALSCAIDELHRQSIVWLVKNYNIIFLPSFDVQNMIGDSSWFNRWMLSLGHYKFKQRLIHKCEQLNKKLVIVDEHYTTKTCSGCGILNHNVGSSKMFECKHCNLSLDRDVNASINILMKSIMSECSGELATSLQVKV